MSAVRLTQRQRDVLSRLAAGEVLFVDQVERPVSQPFASRKLSADVRRDQKPFSGQTIFWLVIRDLVSINGLDSVELTDAGRAAVTK